METNKVIAYSLLAQIRNSGNFINSSVEIFVPIVKYALYKHITQTGVYKGASIESVDQLLTQKVISMIFASIFGLIDLFVFKNLYDKYCNHSNITAYKTNIVIPTELKALNNIGDLPD
jgi:hypothetical protein